MINTLRYWILKDPKEKIKEITINEMNELGWDDDEIHELCQLSELNLINVDMLKRSKN